MELHHAQIDDVAVQEDGNRHQFQEPHAQLGRHELQRGRHLIVDRRGQGQHVNQMQHARPEMLALVPTPRHEQHTTHPKDQPIGDDVVDTRQNAQCAQENRHDDHGDPWPAVALWPGLDGHILQLSQEENARQYRNQRAVAVFGQLPRSQQGRDSPGEVDGRRDRRDQQPKNAGIGKNAQAKARADTLTNLLHMPHSPQGLLSQVA